MRKMLSLGDISSKIFIIRGCNVMLSMHLAKLYRVETRVLVQAMKRNIERFPADFMFQLTSREFKILKSQFVTSRWGGMRRAKPYAFTEQGVAMLSSVLKSRQAIETNIAIMRVFARLRKTLYLQRELAIKLNLLEERVGRHDRDIRAIFEAIHQLMMPPEQPKRRIGFRP